MRLADDSWHGSIWHADADLPVMCTVQEAAHFVANDASAARGLLRASFVLSGLQRTQH